MALQQPQRREMESAVSPFQGRVEDVGMGDIAASLKDLDAGVLQGISKIFMGTTHEVVIDDDLCDAPCCTWGRNRSVPRSDRTLPPVADGGRMRYLAFTSRLDSMARSAASRQSILKRFYEHPLA